MDKGCAVILLLLKRSCKWTLAGSLFSLTRLAQYTSRIGEDDPWIEQMQFEVVRCEVPQWPWTAEAAVRTARVQEVLGKAALG